MTQRHSVCVVPLPIMCRVGPSQPASPATKSSNSLLSPRLTIQTARRMQSAAVCFTPDRRRSCPWGCRETTGSKQCTPAGAKQGNSSRLSQSSELRRSNRSTFSCCHCPDMGLGQVSRAAVLFHCRQATGTSTEGTCPSHRQQAPVQNMGGPE